MDERGGFLFSLFCAIFVFLILYILHLIEPMDPLVSCFFWGLILLFAVIVKNEDFDGFNIKCYKILVIIIATIMLSLSINTSYEYESNKSKSIKLEQMNNQEKDKSKNDIWFDWYLSNPGLW